ncbi:MAG: hypothetical protein NT136_03065 [Candidatus Moranbacteria bacterium]|nr:hypothetical protein [Candidatus Moranbacteria bacterium]
MFDLTKEIELEPRWKIWYQLLRWLMYLAFAVGALYFSYLLLFPSQSFSFFFRSPQSSKNTITDPRNSQNILPEQGQIKAGDQLIFYISTFESYSQAETNLFLEKDSLPIKGGIVTVKKSFRSFFYPLSNPLGLKDGGLIKNKSGYFIISQGKLRKFSSLKIARELGYNLNSFKDVLEQETAYNEKGDEVTSSLEYPDDTIFKISGEFYQLKNQRLRKFISEKAFFNQYSPDKAIEKDENFLKRYEVDENYIGFSDGTLLSNAESVFIASGNKIFPILDPLTFDSMGFDWNDVIPASMEEIGIYEKQKIFYVNDPHPDGTIFAGQDSGRYYYIQNGERHELIGTAVIGSYLNRNPVIVQEKGLEVNQCDLKKTAFFSEVYGCGVSIKNLQSILGNTYQFTLKLDSDARVNNMNVVLKKTVTWQNLRLQLSDIYKKLIMRYAGKQQPKK